MTQRRRLTWNWNTPRPGDHTLTDYPDPKLSALERRQAANTRRHRDTMLELLSRLDDATINELLRRQRHPAQDAHTTGTETGGGNTISAPTEAAAIRDAGGHGDQPDTWTEPDDQVRDAINLILAHLNEAAGLLTIAEKARAYIFAVGDTARGRQSSLQGDCRACGRDVAGTPNDRLKSGYCPACHQAWMRAGYPDRAEFEHTRKEHKEAS